MINSFRIVKAAEEVGRHSLTEDQVNNNKCNVIC